MTPEVQYMRRKYFEWILRDAELYSHALTLTLKPYCRVISDIGSLRVALDEFEAQRTFRHFRKRLDAKLFGKAAQRFGKSAFYLPALEGQENGKLLHYHCAFGNVRNTLTDKQLALAVKEAWGATQFGNQQIKIVPIRDTGWADYISKEIRDANINAIDVCNIRFPHASLA